MKYFKFIKKCPFLLMILISTVVFSIIGYAGKKNIYSDYTIELLKTPQLAVVFEGAGEGKYPWIKTQPIDMEQYQEAELKASENQGAALASASVNSENADPKEETVPYINSSLQEDGQENETDKDITGGITKNDQADQAGAESEKPESKRGISNAPTSAAAENTETANDGGKVQEIETSNKSQETAADEKNTISEASAKNNDNSDEDAAKTDAKSTNADISERGGNKKDDSKANTEIFQTVTQDYFDDALFIGDSRTVGLSEYSGWTNATYFADVGMTIYDIFERKIVDIKGTKGTIPEALKLKQYKKIYIMLGINELGRGTTETFVEEYKKVIEKIQELQPDAIIFIEGIMNVSKEKSDKDPIFNNTNIKDRNEGIAALADDSKTFYIDVNDAITDKKGNLPSKYTFDYIHLKAAYYVLWTDFLLKHGIVEKKD